MTIAPVRAGVVDVITDIAKADPGTAELLAQMATYEALCDEVDRIQPSLDRDISRVVVKRAQGALEAIAKRYQGADDYERAELEELAGGIAQIALIAKEGNDGTVTQDNPQTPWWDARDASGRFSNKGLTAQIMRTIGGTSAKEGQQAGPKLRGGLNLFTQDEDKDTKRVIGAGLENIRSANRYSVARALGQGLQQSGAPGGGTVGGLTRLVGDIGPEAERVFRPGLTRIAYRYRGTEKRPDPRLAAMSRQIAENTKDDDAKRLNEIGRLGTFALYPDLPNQQLAEISLASGKMPPSQGILFDAQGNAISQAMGYNGDHYLPFDLKNLKRLRGGQYVRTRTTGGLTDEDIYTGLMTGARKVTVISNSGVFSVEFDPDLRGARRYSDKARQMVDRYAKLVGAIGQGEKNKDLPLLNDLSREDKAEMRARAFRDSHGNETIATRLYEDYKNKARFERKFTPIDDEKLHRQAMAQAESELRGKQSSTQQLNRRAVDIFRDLRRAEAQKTVRYYQLDGEGYSAAQNALKQEFPYFIRSKSFIPLDEWVRETGAGGDEPPPSNRPRGDLGYTRRNALAPRRVEYQRGVADEDKAKEDKPKSSGSLGFFGAEDEAGKLKNQAQAQQRAETRSQLTDSLADAFARSLALRLDLDTDVHGEPLQGANNETDQQATGIPPDAWADWVLTTKGGPEGAAKFLTNPDTDLQHIRKAKLALARYKPTAQNDPTRAAAFDGFDEAMQLLDQAALVNKPFEKPTENMVLAAPNVTRPAPQPFPEIADRDLDGLVSFARENPELAAEAQAAQTEAGEQTLVNKIKAGVAHINGLLKWPKANGELKPDHTPADKSLTYADAMLANEPDGLQNLPAYQELEQQQKAWALARAVKVSAVHEQAEVPTLAPKEEQGKRAPLPRRAQPSGSQRHRLPPGISKRSPTSPPRQSSPSPLALELAKRLTDDPQYLQRYLG